MNSNLKSLGAVICGLGLVNARLPARIIQHGGVLNVPGADVAELPDEPFRNVPQPVQIPPASELLHGEPLDVPDTDSVSSDGSIEPFDIHYDVPLECQDDYVKFCQGSTIPSPPYEEDFSLTRFYTTSTQIIFAAARRLTGESIDDTAGAESPREGPRFHHLLGRGMHDHFTKYWQHDAAAAAAGDSEAAASPAVPPHPRINGRKPHVHSSDANMGEAPRHSRHVDRHHRMSHMHKHNLHHEHHTHRRTHPHMEPAHPGYAPPSPFRSYSEAEMCIRENYERLSDECREVFEEEPSESEREFHPIMSWVNAIFWLSLATCFCKRAKTARVKRDQVHAVLETVRNNPELKATVESTAGVEVPQLKKVSNCCFFIGPALIVFWAALATLSAICTTGLYFSEENPEAGETFGWVLIAVAAVLVLGMVFALVRKARRASRTDSSRYSYNGSNDGYIALTGIPSYASVPPAENPEQIYMGVPVSVPTSVSAGANAYNPMNVV